MNEMARIKANPYDARMKLIQALNDCGYGTRVVEKKEHSYSITTDYFVIIYKAIDKQGHMFSCHAPKEEK
jgi:hypothetical protein